VRPLVTQTFAELAPSGVFAILALGFLGPTHRSPACTPAPLFQRLRPMEATRTTIFTYNRA
jgi:hypothetical protein